MVLLRGAQTLAASLPAHIGRGHVGISRPNLSPRDVGTTLSHDDVQCKRSERTRFARKDADAREIATVSVERS